MAPASAGIYRQRHPERTVLYRVFAQHFERFVQVYDAGNAYTNVTPIELPHSGMTGSIARSAQLFFPGDEERGRVLMPDFPMRWSEFAQYGFGPDAELQYALDLIAAGRVAPIREREQASGTERAEHGPSGRQARSTTRRR